ncbi:hypothetical protein JV46_01110 [Solemya velum gill symbiont]|uniref:Uncharacterized protein n=1 Tax=Solemya velum gill symbiont TaxID=2340 RepID=A0A0B0H808_SOVGS|nr:hypothetical protein JV46_01110 [Solemya velum gill symbiont]
MYPIRTVDKSINWTVNRSVSNPDRQQECINWTVEGKVSNGTVNKRLSNPDYRQKCSQVPNRTVNGRLQSRIVVYGGIVLGWTSQGGIGQIGQVKEAIGKTRQDRG